MALSYYFSITAAANTPDSTLEQFLKRMEVSARTMGFNPTLVLNAIFDTTERRTFARRLTSGYPLQDLKLAGVVPPAEGQIWNHDPVVGSCRVIPEQAVVLILTDQSGAEVNLGFFRFPHDILDAFGKRITTTGLHGQWIQRDFIDTTDPRYRNLIRMFADSGFLESEKDEYE